MARFDRCEICDYSEASGSNIAGVPRGAHGRVRLHNGQLCCDTCYAAVFEVLIDYIIREEEENGEIQDHIKVGSEQSGTGRSLGITPIQEDKLVFGAEVDESGNVLVKSGSSVSDEEDDWL